MIDVGLRVNVRALVQKKVYKATLFVFAIHVFFTNLKKLTDLFPKLVFTYFLNEFCLGIALFNIGECELCINPNTNSFVCIRRTRHHNYIKYVAKA